LCHLFLFLGELVNVCMQYCILYTILVLKPRRMNSNRTDPQWEAVNLISIWKEIRLPKRAFSATVSNKRRNNGRCFHLREGERAILNWSKSFSSLPYPYRPLQKAAERERECKSTVYLCHSWSWSFLDSILFSLEQHNQKLLWDSFLPADPQRNQGEPLNWLW
jgi:hypothetical protein